MGDRLDCINSRGKIQSLTVVIFPDLASGLHRSEILNMWAATPWESHIKVLFYICTKIAKCTGSLRTQGCTEAKESNDSKYELGSIRKTVDMGQLVWWGNMLVYI